MTKFSIASTLSVCIIFSFSAGCSRENEGVGTHESRIVRFGDWDLESLGASTNGLIRFYDETLQRCGYADISGRVVLEPQYSVCSVTFSEGYAWVEFPYESDAHETNYYDICFGDFIDTNGVRLVGKKLYTTVPEPWMWGYDFEPQFVNGLAFVSADPSDFPEVAMPTNVHPKIREALESKSARYVYCIDTNGIPIAAHHVHGPFYTAAMSSDGPSFRGGCRRTWIDLLNGDRGLLLWDGSMPLTTSVKDPEKFQEIERRFVEENYGTNGVVKFTGQAWMFFYH
ncbi:MAG: WG repeat-containing protein [Kiritimatiellia bacterium]